MKAVHLTACALALWAAAGAGAAQSPPLPPPTFHHLHLNVVDPDALIAYLHRQFPSTSWTRWSGQPALASPTNVLILFNKVSAPPPSDSMATAFWHFGWGVQDERSRIESFRTRPEVVLVPLYTTEDGDYVYVSSDTWAGPDGQVGLTRTEIAEARANGVQPMGGAGFAFIQAPENILIEYTGNMPAEYFNHVHMWQEEPFCAQLWYQEHLEAAVPPLAPGAVRHNDADCKVARTREASWPALTRHGMYRAPRAGVLFGDVSLTWYARQTDTPLVPSRGHLMDHIGLGVTDLDAWIAKLKREGVTFLRPPYRLGDTRAAMIDGPSHEAIELVEVK